MSVPGLATRSNVGIFGTGQGYEVGFHVLALCGGLIADAAAQPCPQAGFGPQADLQVQQFGYPVDDGFCYLAVTHARTFRTAWLIAAASWVTGFRSVTAPMRRAAWGMPKTAQVASS